MWNTEKVKLYKQGEGKVVQDQGSWGGDDMMQSRLVQIRIWVAQTGITVWPLKPCRTC